MTTLYHHIIFLLCMVPINLTATTTATSALRTNPINLSTITQFNLTSSTYTTFFLPSSQYTSNKTSLTPPIDTIYITLSLCSPPNSLIKILPNNLPSSLYLTNSSSFTFNDQKPFLSLTYGFSNFTIDLKGGNNAKGDIIGINDEIKQQGIYIGILSPNLTLLGGTTPTSSSSSLSSSSTEVWNWELTISTNLDNPSNSDGGITILDNSPSFKYEDSDNTTALITSTNYTDPTSLSFFNQGDDTLKPNWKPLIKLTTPLSIALSNSFCAITTTTDVPQVVEVEESVTTRGYGGGERLQFLLKGLESGRNYTVWLVEEFNVGTTTGGVVVVGRRLLEPIYFKTKLGTSCRLLHSLSFCPNVAYSVPSPPTLPTSNLISFYNDTLQPSLSSFYRTLSTFPCDSITMGSYSYISNCENCKERYLDWLCSVTLPRCDDSPSSSSSSSSNVEETNSTEFEIPSFYQQTILRLNPPTSRTPLFSSSLLSTTFPSLNSILNTSSPFPYSEILPCLSLCTLVLSKCPNIIQWGCPSSSLSSSFSSSSSNLGGDGGTGTSSYGVFNGILGLEGRMAGDIHLGSRGLERVEEGRGRAADRWGGVYCNSLGSDMLIAAQFSSASRTFMIFNGFSVILLVVLVIVTI